MDSFLPLCPVLLRRPPSSPHHPYLGKVLIPLFHFVLYYYVVHLHPHTIHILGKFGFLSSTLSCTITSSTFIPTPSISWESLDSFLPLCPVLLRCPPSSPHLPYLGKVWIPFFHFVLYYYVVHLHPHTFHILGKFGFLSSTLSCTITSSTFIPTPSISWESLDSFLPLCPVLLRRPPSSPHLPYLGKVWIPFFHFVLYYYVVHLHPHTIHILGKFGFLSSTLSCTITSSTFIPTPSISWESFDSSLPLCPVLLRRPPSSPHHPYLGKVWIPFFHFVLYYYVVHLHPHTIHILGKFGFLSSTLSCTITSSTFIPTPSISWESLDSFLPLCPVLLRRPPSSPHLPYLGKVWIPFFHFVLYYYVVHLHPHTFHILGKFGFLSSTLSCTITSSTFIPTPSISWESLDSFLPLCPVLLRCPPSSPHLPYLGKVWIPFFHFVLYYYVVHLHPHTFHILGKFGFLSSTLSCTITSSTFIPTPSISWESLDSFLPLCPVLLRCPPSSPHLPYLGKVWIPFFHFVLYYYVVHLHPHTIHILGKFGFLSSTLSCTITSSTFIPTPSISWESFDSSLPLCPVLLRRPPSSPHHPYLGKVWIPFFHFVLYYYVVHLHPHTIHILGKFGFLSSTLSCTITSSTFIPTPSISWESLDSFLPLCPVLLRRPPSSPHLPYLGKVWIPFFHFVLYYYVVHLHPHTFHILGKFGFLSSTLSCTITSSTFIPTPSISWESLDSFLPLCPVLLRRPPSSPHHPYLGKVLIPLLHFVLYYYVVHLHPHTIRILGKFGFLSSTLSCTIMSSTFIPTPSISWESFDSSLPLCPVLLRRPPSSPHLPYLGKVLIPLFHFVLYYYVVHLHPHTIRILGKFGFLSSTLSCTITSSTFIPTPSISWESLDSFLPLCPVLLRRPPSSPHHPYLGKVLIPLFHFVLYYYVVHLHPHTIRILGKFGFLSSTLSCTITSSTFIPTPSISWESLDSFLPLCPVLLRRPPSSPHHPYLGKVLIPLFHFVLYYYVVHLHPHTFHILGKFGFLSSTLSCTITSSTFIPTPSISWESFDSSLPLCPVLLRRPPSSPHHPYLGKVWIPLFHFVLYYYVVHLHPHTIHILGKFGFLSSTLSCTITSSTFIPTPSISWESLDSSRPLCPVLLRRPPSSPHLPYLGKVLIPLFHFVLYYYIVHLLCSGYLMSLAPPKTSSSSQRGERHVPGCDNTLCEGHERRR